MRFFRRRSSPGLAALLAVAMQAALILAQSHVHSHVHAGAGVTAGAPAWASGVVAVACRAIVRPGCKPAVPHDHRNECPMCWSVAAAGTGVLPAAPAVALDAPRFSVPSPLRIAETLPDRTTVNFQARAPPLA
jgi:hypothetical protein